MRPRLPNRTTVQVAIDEHARDHKSGKVCAWCLDTGAALAMSPLFEQIQKDAFYRLQKMIARGASEEELEQHQIMMMTQSFTLGLYAAAVHEAVELAERSTKMRGGRHDS